MIWTVNGNIANGMRQRLDSPAGSWLGNEALVREVGATIEMKGTCRGAPAFSLYERGFARPDQAAAVEVRVRLDRILGCPALRIGESVVLRARR